MNWNHQPTYLRLWKLFTLLSVVAATTGRGPKGLRQVANVKERQLSELTYRYFVNMDRTNTYTNSNIATRQQKGPGEEKVEEETKGEGKDEEAKDTEVQKGIDVGEIKGSDADSIGSDEPRGTDAPKDGDSTGSEEPKGADAPKDGEPEESEEPMGADAPKDGEPKESEEPKSTDAPKDMADSNEAEDSTGAETPGDLDDSSEPEDSPVAEAQSSAVGPGDTTDLDLDDSRGPIQADFDVDYDGPATSRASDIDDNEWYCGEEKGIKHAKKEKKERKEKKGKKIKKTYDIYSMDDPEEPHYYKGEDGGYDDAGEEEQKKDDKKGRTLIQRLQVGLESQ